ncbi:hypothetical protein HMN09_00948700 [Mycena chlorophos]|uniref:F-box domain-containing protein n=1 Tax=Mycena chlorophos TaxID=658473 RepID=A0A8H6SJR7_MYCCL|nr:hypothetical protein HMN09_00948700 [Mycena chlorophos]
MCPWRSPLAKLSLDVVLLILEQCSPFDLAILAASSSALRAALDANPFIWRRAMVGFARGACPAIPPYAASLEETANCSPAAYARYIFGGGKCALCRKPTSSIPYEYLLRLHACSGKCKRGILSRGILFVDREHKYEIHPWGQWLPRLRGTWGRKFVYSSFMIERARHEEQQARDADSGRVLPDDDLPLPFRTTATLSEARAERARSRDALTVNAIALEHWSASYVQEKETVEAANRRFLKARAKEHGLQYHIIMRCPTVACIFTSFNRDLTLITLTVFLQHEQVITNEYQVQAFAVDDTASGTQNVSVPSIAPAQNTSLSHTKTSTLICSHCQDSFTVSSAQETKYGVSSLQKAWRPTSARCMRRSTIRALIANILTGCLRLFLCSIISRQNIAS